jgi:hypothetical protein
MRVPIRTVFYLKSASNSYQLPNHTRLIFFTFVQHSLFSGSRFRVYYFSQFWAVECSNSFVWAVSPCINCYDCTWVSDSTDLKRC